MGGREMTEKTVVVQGDLASECIAYLEGEGLRVDLGTSWDEAELLDRIEGYDALITGPAVRVTAAVLRAGRRLRVVGRTGVGVDTIDVEEATKRGVMVIHAPRSTLVSDIEQALAELLACARGLVRMDADLRRAGGTRRLERRPRRAARQDAGHRRTRGQSRRCLATLRAPSA